MKKFLTTVLLLSSLGVMAQNQYIVYFDHKNLDDLEYYENHPELLFSTEAISKKRDKGIAIDFHDLPISQKNLDVLSNNHCRIIHTSKWLNAVLIESSNTASDIRDLSDRIQYVQTVTRGGTSSLTHDKLYGSNADVRKSHSKANSIDYGLALFQNELIGVNHLHNAGYLGKNVTIAILDVGFLSADTSSYFDSVRYHKQILNTYDFWSKSAEVYHTNSHGTYVLSLIGGNTPTKLVGTAPAANFLLAITDDFHSETHQDEFNWIKAVEWADSIGVDIISSSVSYYVFDPGQGDYGYEDMDGNTSIIARGADIAASKGLIVVNSGGNGGKITTPCDADSILCVGGVNSLLNYDEISSTGPSYDGRVKPDVSGLTRNVWGVFVTGLQLQFYGGTSGSTPMISGMAACLKEAHPQRSNMTVIESIKRSAHQYQNPDSLIGYGVPNGRIADSLLTLLDNSSAVYDLLASKNYLVYPNPTKNKFTVKSVRGNQISTIEVFTSLGQLVDVYSSVGTQLTINTSQLKKQTYLVKITNTVGEITVTRLVKM